jgi:hypothetical protein
MDSLASNEAFLKDVLAIIIENQDLGANNALGSLINECLANPDISEAEMADVTEMLDLYAQRSDATTPLAWPETTVAQLEALVARYLPRTVTQ